MNKLIKIIFLLCAIVFGGCIINQHLNWNEVQDVGGLKIDNIRISGNKYFIPIYCNVSGTEAVSTKPKTLNSGLAFKGYKHKIVNDKILLSIIVTLSNNGYKNCSSGNNGIYLNKKDLKYNKYMLSYENKDGSLVNLKEVEIK